GVHRRGSRVREVPRDGDARMIKRRDKKFSEEETTKPEIDIVDIARATPLPVARIPLAKAPPLDLAAVESEYGWWEAILKSDIRLFEAWLTHHGAIIISARTIERFDAFFQGLTSRHSIELKEHEV